MSFQCIKQIYTYPRSNVVSRLSLWRDPPLQHHFLNLFFLLLCSHHGMAFLEEEAQNPFSVECQKHLFYSFSTPKCVGGAPIQSICGCPLCFSACSSGWRSCSANKWMTMTKLIALLFFPSSLSLCTVKSPIWHQSSARKLAGSPLSVSKIREFLAFNIFLLYYSIFSHLCDYFCNMVYWRGMDRQYTVLLPGWTDRSVCVFIVITGIVVMVWISSFVCIEWDELVC